MTQAFERDGLAGRAARGRLLVFQDSPQFGGHEIMFLRIFHRMLARNMFERVRFHLPWENHRLRDALEALEAPALDIAPWSFQKGSGEPYCAGFRFAYRRAVQASVRSFQPNVALLIQGRIENCAVPMLTLPSQLKLVSYLPMAHRMREMSRSGLIGDRVRRRLYRRPDRFIVPSRAVAEQVGRAGGQCQSVVIENVVKPPPRANRDTARAALQLPANRRIAVFVGRLDVRQKGLDTLASAMRREAAELRHWTFLFVGEGEGSALVEALSQIGLDVRITGWTDQPHAYIAAADVLLMPSRWEGVPLVMLEAMTYGVPLLTSTLDVFQDYLPAESLIDYDSGSMADALERLTQPDVRARVAAHAGIRLPATEDSKLDPALDEAFLFSGR